MWVPHSHLNPDLFSALLSARVANLSRLDHPDWPIRDTMRKPKSGRRDTWGVCSPCSLHVPPKGCWWLYGHTVTLLWEPPPVHFSSGSDSPIPIPPCPSALRECMGPCCSWFWAPCHPELIPLPLSKVLH